MNNMRRGPIPSDIGWLADLLDSIERRLFELETPDSAQYNQTVSKLAAAQAELATVVAGIDATLSAFIATGVQPIVEAAVADAVADALAATFAGNVSIGGNLYVGGEVNMPGVRGRNISAVASRVVVWAGGSGEMGHTS